RSDVENVRHIGTIAAFDVRNVGQGYLSSIAPKLYRYFVSQGVLLRPIGQPFICYRLTVFPKRICILSSAPLNARLILSATESLNKPLERPFRDFLNATLGD